MEQVKSQTAAAQEVIPYLRVEPGDGNLPGCEIHTQEPVRVALLYAALRICLFFLPAKALHDKAVPGPVNNRSRRIFASRYLKPKAFSS